MKTQTYFLGSEIVCKIWIHLYESGHEKLASSLSRSMIKQGCEELLGTNDGNVIFAFWKEYLIENNIIEITEHLN